MNGDLLITVASWEERFAAGVERSLGLGGVAQVICLASTRYQEITRSPIGRANRACNHAGVLFDSCHFDFENQVSIFHQVKALQQDARVLSARNVIFDLSTAPRSVVWAVLGALNESRSEAIVRYHAALEYADWHTLEEGEPKLILNRSGVMFPDLPTCLVMLCGPEISRAEKLCYRFEPKKALLLRDPRASQFGSIKSLPRDYADVTEETAFDNKNISGENLIKLERMIAPYAGTHNIVAASLGPKLGALLLFELSMRNEDVALSYVTSGKHNLSATRGIGDMTDVRVTFTSSRSGK